MTRIDDVIGAARELRPNFWERTEQVARIIDPAAFLDCSTAQPREAAESLRVRLDYLQAVALSKAQAVLQYLGVNTEVDWLAVLQLLASRRAAEDFSTVQ